MADMQLVQMLKSGQEDLEWFDSNLNALLKDFNNMFIAFRNKRVIESDQDLNRLMQKLKEEDVDTSNVFVKFVSKVKYIL